MFKEIFEQAPGAMLVVTAEGTISLANREAELLFGYGKGELTDQPVEILVPSPSKEKHPALFRNYLHSPTPRAMGAGRNLFGQKKDGSRIPIEVGLKPLNKDGKVFILSSIVDLTHRIRAEEKFRAAFEAAPNAMIMVDREATILLANDVALQLFGYSIDELRGHPVEILVPEGTRKVHPGYVEAFMRNPASRAMGLGRVLHARKKDGTLFPVEIGLRPFQGMDGLYVISSVVDLTEIMRVRKHLMDRNEEIQQFAYRTSHDLKAPLVSINGLAKFVKEDVRAGNLQEVDRNVDRIVQLSDRLQTTISTIIALMKADNVDESPAPVDFEKVVQHCEEALRTQLDENQVEIRTRLSSRAPFVSQPLRISQIVENLVSNGIKYRDASKEANFIEISTRDESEYLTLTIEDNGLGIPAERHSEVFSMFKRFHASSVQGSGLGLYLVKKQVDRLGGSITFESSRNGTRFEIHIPRNPVPPFDATEKLPPSS